MSTTALHVRSYECDSLGHVNNAVYLQYLQHATHASLGAALNARKLAIEYHAPARDADELKIATWIASITGECISCGYEITRPSDHASIVRAQIEWNNPERGKFALETDHRPVPLKPFVPTSDNGAKPFRWRHELRRYELDSSNQASLAVYFNWLEQATYGYCEQVGWGIERLRKEDFIVLQRRHDAEFFAPARYGDQIEIVSRLIEMRRVRGTWVHEATRLTDKQLVMRDYSTGAFVDWNGNIKPALAPMMNALINGEPG